jgi:hypothetical protein
MEGCLNSQNTHNFFLEKNLQGFKRWLGFNEIDKNTNA